MCIQISIIARVSCARVVVYRILAPKLTSRACALRVCSPPAAIAVTQAISQTLICKALRINSPSHAQMNKQRHKTWSFCLKYIYCLSRIKFKDRWVVFFIYDSFCWTKSPTAAGLGSRNDAMETMIIPTSLRSETLLFSHKMKDTPLKYMIRI